MTRVSVTTRYADIPGQLSIGVSGNLSSRTVDVLSTLVEPYWGVGDFIAPASLNLSIDFDAARIARTVGLAENGVLMSLPSGLSPNRVAYEILWCCRLLIKMALIECGGVNVHSSGFTRDGYACLISGPRFMGKTTSVLNVLRSDSKTKFLANDQVVLLFSKKRTVAIGFPSLVSIRDNELLAEVSRVRPFREVARSDGASDGIRREFSVHSLGTVLGFSIDSSATVKCMVELSRGELSAASKFSMKSSDWILENSYPLDSQYDAGVLRTVRGAVARLDVSSVSLGYHNVAACRLKVPDHDFKGASRAIISCFDAAAA